ncbi:MAG TPA: molybdenum cofactor guanylyltransferase [Nocardioidaceae bacterium]
MTEPRPRRAAVILTGGTALRLGGADKASLELEGTSLMEHAMAATAGTDETVVVGPEVPTSRSVAWTREEPPGGGPAAGLLAGLDALAVRPDLVCVLAVDMPRFSARTLERLTAAVGSSGEEVDAACLVDEDGRMQWLAGVYRYDALAAARPSDRAEEHGLSTKRLMSRLRIVAVPAVEDEAHDVDTWEDLRRLGR